MKATAIPAQITTVEDRIAGNLSMTQIILLVIPLFIAAAVYFILPPFGHFNLYKVILTLFTGLVFGLLAFRLKEKLVIDWLRLRLRYEIRPRTYVYSRLNKPSEDNYEVREDKKISEPNKVPAPRPHLLLESSELSLTMSLLQSSAHAVTFKISKKGGLDVQVGEVG